MSERLSPDSYATLLIKEVVYGNPTIKLVLLQQVS